MKEQKGEKFKIVVTGSIIENDTGCFVDTDGVSVEETTLVIGNPSDYYDQLSTKRVIARSLIYALAKQVVENEEDIKDVLNEVEYNIKDVKEYEGKKENENN